MVLMALWSIVLILFLEGCPGEKGNLTDESSVKSDPKVEASSEVESVFVEPEAHDRVNMAIEDLTDRAGVSADEIVVISERQVTWRNGSLGCPRPDMMYTQVLIEGKLIVLRVGGKSHQYHSGGDRPPFYCENPEKPAARPGAD